MAEETGWKFLNLRQGWVERTLVYNGDVEDWIGTEVEFRSGLFYFERQNEFTSTPTGLLTFGETYPATSLTAQAGEITYNPGSTELAPGAGGPTDATLIDRVVEHDPVNRNGVLSIVESWELQTDKLQFKRADGTWGDVVNMSIYNDFADPQDITDELGSAE